MTNTELNNVVSAWSNWFKFSGQRSRASAFLALVATGLIFGMLEYIPIVGFVFSLANLYVLLAIISQRFRDMGKSGWWALITLIPFVMLWPLLSAPNSDSTKKQILWTKIWIPISAVLLVLIILSYLTLHY